MTDKPMSAERLAELRDRYRDSKAVSWDHELRDIQAMLARLAVEGAR